MKNQRKASLFILALLFFGALIYGLTRTDHLYLNRQFASFAGRDLFSGLKPFISAIHLPGWVIYALPDGLWMAAFILMMLKIWNFRLTQVSGLWIGLAFLTGILFEILQGFHWIDGTFDFQDLTFLFCGGMVPILFTMINYRTCKAN